MCYCVHTSLDISVLKAFIQLVITGHNFFHNKHCVISGLFRQPAKACMHVFLQASEYTGCVSLITLRVHEGAHTCCGRHSQYSCELLASRVPGVALHGL